MSRRPLTRRRFGALAMAAAPSAPRAGQAAADPAADTTPPNPRDCEPTRLIDSDHPAIAGLAAALSSGAGSDRERAVRIHDAVRDRVRFGIAPAFYAMRAGEVFQEGVGCSNTKTTPFAALLRSAGIATRIGAVELSAASARSTPMSSTRRWPASASCARAAAWATASPSPAPASDTGMRRRSYRRSRARARKG
jgi:transglutaminase-like putative cysteine protease